MRLLPTVPVRRGAILLGACFALSACENPLADKAPSLEKVLSSGWLFGDLQEAEPVRRTPEPIYCYETIGVGDCFDEPLEGGEERLVGFEGPEPRRRLAKP